MNWINPFLAECVADGIKGGNRMHRMLTATRALVGAFLLACFSLGASASTYAEPVSDFYKGKTVYVMIGTETGGGFDHIGRLVARWLGKYIPGNPRVVPQNQAGAAGLLMTNNLYNVMANDGTYIGLVLPNLPTFQAIGDPGVHFDASKLQWIGSVTPTIGVIAFWQTSGVKTIADARAKEQVMGALSKSAASYSFLTMTNQLVGTKFKIVTGYPGGQGVSLAMERGEIEGMYDNWQAFKSTKAAWIADHKINIILQRGGVSPDLPDVPLIDDLAANADDRGVVALLTADARIGQPFAVGPGVPADRVEALRTAFAETMKDPDFLKDAAQSGDAVSPIGGEQIQQLVHEMLGTRPDLVSRAKKILE
jgi:tripartite-type tricarboxylate transporter receptor subunit TctC